MMITPLPEWSNQTLWFWPGTGHSRCCLRSEICKILQRKYQCKNHGKTITCFHFDMQSFRTVKPHGTQSGTPADTLPEATEMRSLARRIKRWATELGFQQTGISCTDIGRHESRLLNWLREGMHGDMDFMEKHGSKRTRPAQLIPGTLTIISVRMNYLPPGVAGYGLDDDASDQARIARYALGGDYHKLIRKRLQKLAEKITQASGSFQYRAFCDSAPVMEKAIAEQAGLGWIGKNTLVINRRVGSWFFLGELYTNLPLPVSRPAKNHCGTCRRCLDVCPTRAIIAPYQLDANRCIAYLTIEHKGSIPEALRPLIGNRVFGCDDCQTICPWNRFAKNSAETAFDVRNGLDVASLLSLWDWDEKNFSTRTRGSTLSRLGYERWLRNLAVGLGNAPQDKKVAQALHSRLNHPSALVREHVSWALLRQTRQTRQTTGEPPTPAGKES